MLAKPKLSDVVAQSARQDVIIGIRKASLAYSGYGEMVPALAEADIEVRAGELIAIVGPSGCGKSSLMKLVSGLIPPTSGEIVVRGKRVTKPIAGVGMAFQNPTLFPWRTTIDNVMLPLELVKPYADDFRRKKSEYREKALSLLASVGLDGFAQKFPWQLSGGMQQRANLCRALIHEPEILLLDEPFGALDQFTREDLWSVMQDLSARKRFAAILVTHDLREAVFLADTVYVMSRRPGRVISVQTISIPRPRTLETTFTPQFTEIVHELRTLISKEHVVS